MRLPTLLLLCCSPFITAASCGGQKPDGGADVATPEHTVTVRRFYVPIDAALTGDCPVEPSGVMSDAPNVAAKRKAALEECTGRMRAIRDIEGTLTED